MKLKTITTADGKTYAEISDGKPVYIHDDGKERRSTRRPPSTRFLA